MHPTQEKCARVEREFPPGSVSTGAAPPPRSPAVISPALAAVCLALISAAYCYAAVARSSTAHLWMDEVLAVSVARLPSVADIWSAIWSGSEFSPPTYDMLLHAFAQLVGTRNGLLVWRIPSIVAVYGAAVCIYALVRPRLNRVVALAAFAVVLGSGLFEFAVQARQYALLAFGMAASLLLWAGFRGTRFPRTRSVALWLVLSGCLLLHFYGIVEVAVIAAAELIRWISRRQFRLGIWLPLVLTAPVEILLSPLAFHLAAFNAADNRASDFYAKPEPAAFTHAIFQILLGGEPGALLLVWAFVILGAVYLLRRPTPAPLRNGRLGCERADGRLSELEIAILALCALPVIVFAFALFVTGSFSARYMSAAALLSGLAAAYMLDRLPFGRAVALALLPLIVAVIVSRSRAPDALAGALAVLQTPRPPLPVVVGEGLLFIELMEAADAPTRSMLVFLKRPPGSVSPDPTNENQAARVTAFRSDFHVEEQADFLKSNPKFYVLSRPNWTTDMTTPSLLEQHLLGRPLAEVQGALLLEAGGAR
jgi:hypothetical protein